VEKDLLGLLDKIQMTNGTSIGLIPNKDAIERIQAIHKDPLLTHLFDAMMTEESLRLLFWSHQIQLIPFYGVDLPLLYAESGKNATEEPLVIEADRATSRLKVVTLDALDRFLPNIKGFINKLEANSIRRTEDDHNKEIDKKAEETQAISIIANLPLWDEIQREKMIKSFFRRAGDIVVPAAVDILSILKLEIIRVGRNHFKQLCKTLHMEQERLTILINRLLTKYEVIHPSISVAWCNTCLKTPQTLISIGQQEPPIIHCPVCKSEMNIGTFFHFSSALANLMTMPDGVVHIAVLWSLCSGKEVSWLPGVYLEGVDNDTEKDVVFKSDEADGYGVIETKVYALDKPDRSLKENIAQDAIDLLNNCQAYIERGVLIDSIMLITNAPVRIVDEVMAELKIDSKMHSLYKSLEIVSPENFNTFHDSFH